METSDEKAIIEALTNRMVEAVYQHGYNPEYPQGVGNLFEFSLRNEDGREVLTVIPNKNLEAEEKEKIKQYDSKKVKAAIYDIEKVWFMPPEEYEKHIREVYTGDHLSEEWFSQVVKDHEERRYKVSREAVEEGLKIVKEMGLEKAIKKACDSQVWRSQFIV